MSPTNYKQVFAKQKACEKVVLNANPNMPRTSGIYFLTRKDEDGINYFYIGQAVNLLQRMCSHMTGYQHIDLSLHKRGFYSKDNEYGWKLNFIEYPKEKLDEMEQHWILEYTKMGYQCRYNKTAGGQGEGKEKINEFRPSRGYRDGIQQGRKNYAREIKALFDKHLNAVPKSAVPNRYQLAAVEKFKALLNEADDNRRE